jgi:hypothetical protein
MKRSWTAVQAAMVGGALWAGLRRQACGGKHATGGSDACFFLPADVDEPGREYEAGQAGDAGDADEGDADDEGDAGSQGGRCRGGVGWMGAGGGPQGCVCVRVCACACVCVCRVCVKPASVGVTRKSQEPYRDAAVAAADHVAGFHSQHCHPFRAHLCLQALALAPAGALQATARAGRRAGAEPSCRGARAGWRLAFAGPRVWLHARASEELEPSLIFVRPNFSRRSGINPP